MQKKLRHIAYEAKRMLAERSPYDTGNMRSSIIIECVKKGGIAGGGEYRIIIPAEDVPYTVYTNEKWISPKWRGAHNPHEHWFDNAVADIVQHITNMFDGSFSVNEKELNARLENREYNDNNK